MRQGLFIVALGFLIAVGCRHKSSPDSGAGQNSLPLPSNPAPAPSPTTTPSPSLAPTPSTGTTPSEPRPTPTTPAPPPVAPPPQPGRPTPSPSPTITPTPTPPATPQTLLLYDDANTLESTDPNAIGFSGMAVNEHDEGGAAEGTKFMRAGTRPGGNDGVTFDRFFKGVTRDLSDYAQGHLRFFVRIDHVFASTEGLTVQIADGTSASPPLTLMETYGFSSQTPNVWQEITIPIASFTGVDLKKIQIPFQINVIMPTDGRGYALDQDFIRWTKT